MGQPPTIGPARIPMDYLREALARGERRHLPDFIYDSCNSQTETIVIGLTDYGVVTPTIGRLEPRDTDQVFLRDVQRILSHIQIQDESALLIIYHGDSVYARWFGMTKPSTQFHSSDVPRLRKFLDQIFPKDLKADMPVATTIPVRTEKKPSTAMDLPEVASVQELLAKRIEEVIKNSPEPLNVNDIKGRVSEYIRGLELNPPSLNGVKIRAGDRPDEFFLDFTIHNPTPEMIELARAMKENNGKQP